MHDHGIALGDAIQDMERPACGIHKILGDDLKPIDLRPVLQDVIKVRTAETDSEAEIGKTEPIRHDFFGETYAPGCLRTGIGAG